MDDTFGYEIWVRGIQLFPPSTAQLFVLWYEMGSDLLVTGLRCGGYRLGLRQGANTDDRDVT